MKYFAVALLIASLPAAASAQYYGAGDPTLNGGMSADRLERLERDLQVLQRQIARGGVATGAPTVMPSGEPVPADLEVRLSAIEQDIRELRGKLEQSEFQSRKASEAVDKLQKDVDLRLRPLEQGQMPTAATPATEAEKKPVNKPATPTPPPGESTAGDGTLKVTDDSHPNLAKPRDLYNHAFKLINQTRYEEAAQHFSAFTQKYPQDPLVGNAYYWLGETYYIKQDYVKAADHFRQGFETLPNGPKAADNLLKLGMSMNALKKDREACVVFKQITIKFRNSSSSVVSKAQQEMGRIGCQ